MSNNFKASEAQKSAVDALQKFYSVIIGAAFTGAVLKFLDNFSIDNWSQEQYSQIFLVIAFIFTIVPFYHGMERHLFEAHIKRNSETWGEGGKPTPLIVDIGAFMLMGAILFAMGRSTDSPDKFFWFWVSLLVVDIIWSVFAQYFNKSKWPIWAINNLGWLVLALFLWLAVVPWALSTKCIMGISYLCGSLFVKTMLVSLVEICRSVIDYTAYWKFYFPPPENTKSETPQPSERNLVYLAGPYSNNAPESALQDASHERREARFNAITHVAAFLIEREVSVYSPLTMTHPIDLKVTTQQNSNFWVQFDEDFMEHCKEIMVLKLPGWNQSSGVLREIEYFCEKKLPITFLEPEDYGITSDNPEFSAAFPKQHTYKDQTNS